MTLPFVLTARLSSRTSLISSPTRVLRTSSPGSVLALAFVVGLERRENFVAELNIVVGLDRREYFVAELNIETAEMPHILHHPEC